MEKIKKTRAKRKNLMEKVAASLAAPVEKDSRVLQAEIALRRNLRAGSWERYLPGIRTLAQAFGVSPATMVKAVDRVRADGWISNEGARMRFVVHRDVILNSKGREAFLRTLVILAPKSGRTEPARGTSQVLLRMWENLTPKGWSIRFHLDDYANGKRRQKQWDEIIEFEKPQAVVSILGTPAMAAWAREKKIPMYFCGGSMGEWTVPIVAISSSQMVNDALDHLTALGHEKIVMPLMNREQEFAHRVKETFRKKMLAHGYSYREDINTPTLDGNDLASFTRVLEASFGGINPTAIICFDWREYLAAWSFVRNRGLQVPQDISLISLSHDHSADWLIPTPTLFSHPIEKLAQTLADWLEDVTTYQNYNLQSTVRGTLLEGGTTARCKK